MTPLTANFTAEIDGLQLSEREFQRVAERINKMAGIVLEPRKKQMICSRLSRRLKALEIVNFADYLALLDGADGEAEYQNFLNALTTNLTSFFRENHHFEFLRTNVIAPALQSNQQKLRIWSAGCSTGEEPYSVGLCLAEATPQVPQDFRILATDIDTQVLEQCRRGRYNAEGAEDLLSQHKNRLKLDKDADQFEVSKAVRDLVTFRQLNLMQDWPMSGPFDTIFCRNVLIYFSRETKSSLIDRFANLLRPGGYLFLGHSEPILQEHPLLISLGQTMYQRQPA